MWLLDANVDVHLLSLLREYGVECDAATKRGWGALSNGDLVATAAAAGFTVLLTRDRLFAESAAPVLKTVPGFSVVFVRLRQWPWREYREEVRAAWDASPIRPVAGQVVEWPPK